MKLQEQSNRNCVIVTGINIWRYFKEMCLKQFDQQKLEVEISPDVYELTDKQKYVILQTSISC